MAEPRPEQPAGQQPEVYQVDRAFQLARLTGSISPVGKAADAPYIGPDDWLKATPRIEGSWWPQWTKWLAALSGEPCEPPRIGAGHADGHDLPDAPGEYVRQ